MRNKESSDKNIKVVSLLISQALILITSVLLICLSLKYDFKIQYPLLVLIVTEFFLGVMYYRQIFSNRKN